MKTKTFLIGALASTLAACGATESSSPSSQESFSVTEASAGKSTLTETDDYGYDNTSSRDDTKLHGQSFAPVALVGQVSL